MNNDNGMENSVDNTIGKEEKPLDASASGAVSYEATQDNSALQQNVPNPSPAVNESAPYSTFAPECTYGGFKTKWEYEAFIAQKEKKAASKKRNGLLAFSIVMSVLFVACACAIGYFYSAGYLPTILIMGEEGEETPSPAETRDYSSIIPEELPGDEISNQQIISQSRPAVVAVYVTTTVNNGYTSGTAYSLGSGFIFDYDEASKTGYIITNHHVVENAESVKIYLDDDTEYQAKILGSDPYSDIAVLSIQGENLPVLPLGNSDYVLQGDRVVAIGSPRSLSFAGTATAGIVSFIDRDLPIYDDYGNFIKTMTVIQTDASVNSGNSGGPLINANGQVIGVISMKLSGDYEGIGFALPINGVVSIAEELINNGKVTTAPSNYYVSGKATLGVQIRQVTEEEMEEYSLPAGIYVVYITKDGAADAAGIKQGDIITEFDGEAVTTNQQLSSMVQAKKPGDEVSVKVYRDGKTLDMSVTLIETIG